jgi:hypothetical protein
MAAASAFTMTLVGVNGRDTSGLDAIGRDKSRPNAA